MRMYGGYGKNDGCEFEKSVTCTRPSSDTVIVPVNPTDELVEKITKWHHDRNLIEGSTDKDQYCKLIQEAGELSDNICKGKDVADDIGDMMVVLINIAERNGLSLVDCLSKAWDDIKDRKGRMVDGVFVKESDDNANS